MGDTPQYTPAPIDPTTLAAEQMAQTEQVQALQTRTTGDTASLMAQYGILAMAANTGGAPQPNAANPMIPAPAAAANGIAATLLTGAGRS